ncbi:MAG: 50S ribosomal protein L24e [Candidatus Pacearchaeota archaeon]
MKCAFCKKNYELGKGLIFVTDSGSVFWFCSKKCRRNWELGRKPQKLKWARKKAT